MTKAENPIPRDLVTMGSEKLDLVDSSQNLKPCLDPVPYEDPGNFFDSPTPSKPDTQEDFVGSSEQQRQQASLPILPNFQLANSITDTKIGNGRTTPNFFNGLDSKDIDLFGGNNKNDATTGQQLSYSDLYKLFGGNNNNNDDTTGQQPSYSYLVGNNYRATTDQPISNPDTSSMGFPTNFRFKRRETYNYFHPGGL